MTETMRITNEVMGRRVLGGQHAKPDAVVSIFTFLAGAHGRWITGQTIAVGIA